jgi:Zn-finger nucleic acid-binding protein
MDLQTLKRGSVEVDTCFHCRGVWLNESELEQLPAHGLHESGSVMKAVLNIFRRKMSD